MPKILLVDDSEANRDLLVRRLTPHGFEVRCAPDGPSGIAMAAQEQPHLILMDLALGEMDGFEAIKIIKSIPAIARTPIIALTAHALADDRRRSREDGCVDFDTNPVDLQRLIRKIRAALSGSEPKPALVKPPAAKSRGDQQLTSPAWLDSAEAQTGSMSCDAGAPRLSHVRGQRTG